MKTVKRTVIQKLSGDTVKQYEIWLVPPKRFKKMKKKGLVCESPAQCCSSWTFANTYDDDNISIMDIIYDEKATMEQNAIYIIQSNELLKFNIGKSIDLFMEVDGMWTMEEEDIREHFTETFPLYRLFNSVSEMAKYRLST